jgi:hypothetical protein
MLVLQQLWVFLPQGQAIAFEMELISIIVTFICEKSSQFLLSTIDFLVAVGLVDQK